MESKSATDEVDGMDYKNYISMAAKKVDRDCGESVLYDSLFVFLF
jgi:hypothetical protein